MGQVLLSNLRPILAGLPTTKEGVSDAEMREELRRAKPTVTLSPTRRKVLRMGLIVMPFIMIALFISRAVDRREAAHEPILQALYLANAAFGALVILLSLYWVAFVLLRRREWYTKA
jgi:hypothetical protein